MYGSVRDGTIFDVANILIDCVLAYFLVGVLVAVTVALHRPFYAYLRGKCRAVTAFDVYCTAVLFWPVAVMALCEWGRRRDGD